MNVQWFCSFSVVFFPLYHNEHKVSIRQWDSKDLFSWAE